MMHPSRREFIAASVLSRVQPPAVAFAQPADGEVIAAWMDQWISEQRATVGTLHLSRFVEPIYYLLKPTVWLPDPGQQRFRPVNVPVGFVTDFASIPRIFWSALRPDGNYTHPAVVHDYLYWTQSTSREDADDIFRIMMEDFSISAVTSTAIYSAVRVFGGIAWDDNAKLRASGEKRVLKKFPDDPLTTWKDWKQKPEVFMD
jgi:Protein of unknown function (DUF1353)